MKQPIKHGTPVQHTQPGNGPNYLLQISPEELSEIVRRNMAAVLEERIPPNLNERISTVEERITAAATNRDDYLTRKETAQMLHLTLATLHDMEKRRELLPVRIGRRVLYRRGDIEKALRKGGSHGRK